MKKRLYLFDLDDTLITHDYNKLAIYVRNTSNNIVQIISYKDFTAANFTLPQLVDKCTYDFSDWHSADTFAITARPVATMISMMTAYTKQKDTTVEILTARPNFDNKDLFAQTMASFGIDIYQVYVRRAGSDMHNNYDVAQRKKHLIGCEVMLHDYTDVTMYDDNLDNLRAFLELKENFPWLTLIAYQVNVNNEPEIIRRIEHAKCNVEVN